MNLDDLVATPAVAEAAFACARGHGQAARVRLHHAAGDWGVVVESFVCTQTCRVGAAAAARLRECLEAVNAAGLYRLDLELAPFYCPTCDAVYCGACWRTWNVFDDELPGWFEETRGCCPAGHERMLMD